MTQAPIRVPVEDRLALQDLMTAYCWAVDDLEDLEALLALFTDDAVLDFSAIDLPVMAGKAAFRQFYQGVFADMSHHAHYISNFRVEAWDGDSATLWAYAQGLGRGHDGNEVHVHVKYRMTAARRGDGWIITRYEIHPNMPLPGSMEEMHGHR